MGWSQYIVTLTLAVGGYITPQHYKDIVHNCVNNYVNTTAGMEEINRWTTVQFKNFMNQNTEENALDSLKEIIQVDPNGKTDITAEKKYKNFEERHICEVGGEIQPDKFDKIIENIGKDIGIPETKIEKMKLSQYKKITSYSISHFDHSSNGMYIYGRYEAVRNKNKEMNYVLALYKVTWNPPSSEITKSYQELYEEWSQLHDGTSDMVPEQGEIELKKKFELFIKVFRKEDRDEAYTMKESKELEKYFRQLADQKNKDECKPELLKISEKTMAEG